MTDYGTKIAQLRAANKMTQAQLGEQLNVTSQAVSKWENGLSEPDIESIRKICKIFNITFDEFFGAEPKQEPTKQEIEETTSQTDETATQPVAIVLAYCDTCDKPLYNPKEYQVTIENGVQHTTCLECIPKKEEEQKRKEQARIAEEKQRRDERFALERQARQEVEKDELKKGLLWGIAGGVGLAAIMLIWGLVVEEPMLAIVGSILGAYGGYAILTQLIWMNSVWNVFSFFLRSFKLPAIIFALSIDGILFFIFVKIAGAILGAILSVIFFIVGFFVTWIYAMIIFPFALIKQIRDIKKMY